MRTQLLRSTRVGHPTSIPDLKNTSIYELQSDFIPLLVLTTHTRYHKHLLCGTDADKQGQKCFQKGALHKLCPFGCLHAHARLQMT